MNLLFDLSKTMENNAGTIKPNKFELLVLSKNSGIIFNNSIAIRKYKPILTDLDLVFQS